MIELLVLGTAGAVPVPGRAPTANLVTINGQKLLVDAGPGALSRLVSTEKGINSLDELETLFFTHFHPDHCNDLVHLLFAMRCPALLSEKPLQFYGPEGFKKYFGELKKLYGSWLTPLRREVVINEIMPDESVSLENGGNVTPFLANHSETKFSKHNFGYKFSTQSDTLVISGDSGPSAKLEKAALECDILLVECSTPDELAVDGHMTPSTISALCEKTNPKLTVLTHFYPAAAELDLVNLVNRNYSGSIVMAKDGDYFFTKKGQ